jgi:imidazolonepropionase-like amidohydrolase
MPGVNGCGGSSAGGCRTWGIRLFLLTLPGLAVLPPGPPVSAQVPGHGEIYLRAARAVDGGGNRIPGPVIHVRDNRIVSVAAGGEVPSGARVLDLGDATILPGLIDAHVHITNHFDAQGERRSLTALHGARSARVLLEHGFTTVRTLGSPDYADVDLRDAIREGLVPGPRLLVSGNGISEGAAAGAEGDRARVGEPPAGEGLLRELVRERAAAGVDWIKVFATRSSRAGGTPTYSREQLDWIVDEARRARLPVSIHAHAAEGVRRAVLAGARTVEHGSLLDEEVIRLMASRPDVYLAPNLYLSEYYLQHGQRFGYGAEELEWTARLLPVRTETFGEAFRGGVSIVFSTDANSGWIWSGTTALEFDRRSAAGQTAADIVVSATSRAAEALMLADSLGDLKPGLLADIIAVDGDPLEDVSALGRVVFVMLDGRVVPRPPAGGD